MKGASISQWRAKVLEIGQESGGMVGSQRVASREGAKSARGGADRKTDAAGIGSGRESAIANLVDSPSSSTVSTSTAVNGSTATENGFVDITGEELSGTVCVNEVAARRTVIVNLAVETWTS